MGKGSATLKLIELLMEMLDSLFLVYLEFGRRAKDLLGFIGNRRGDVKRRFIGREKAACVPER